MWVFCSTAFLSAVTDRNNPNRLLIRARCRNDLDDFRKKYCKRMGPTIGRNELGHGSDYPFRAWCGKKAFANAMRKVIMDMMYANFKNEVTKEQGWERHNVYMDVWSTMSSAASQGKLDGTYKAPTYKAGTQSGEWWNRGFEDTGQSREDLLAMGYTPDQIEDPFFCSDGNGAARLKRGEYEDDWNDDTLVSDLIGQPVRPHADGDADVGPNEALEFDSLEDLTDFFFNK